MTIIRMLAAACLAAAVVPAQEAREVIVVQEQDPKPAKAPKAKHGQRAERIRARLAEVVDKLEAGELSADAAKEQLLALTKRLEKADAADKRDNVVVERRVHSDAVRRKVAELRASSGGSGGVVVMDKDGNRLHADVVELHGDAAQEKIAKLRASGNGGVVVMDEDGNRLRASVVELHGDGGHDAVVVRPGKEGEARDALIEAYRNRGGGGDERRAELLERVHSAHAQGQGQGDAKAGDKHEAFNKLQKRAEELRRRMDDIRLEIGGVEDVRVEMEDVRRAVEEARRKADVRRLEVEEVHEHAREAHRKAMEAHREAAEAHEGDVREERGLRLDLREVRKAERKAREAREWAENAYEQAQEHLRRAEEARERSDEREVYVVREQRRKDIERAAKESGGLFGVYKAKVKAEAKGDGDGAKKGGVFWHVEVDDDSDADGHAEVFRRLWPEHGKAADGDGGVIRQLLREHAADGDAHEGHVLRFLNRSKGDAGGRRILKQLVEEVEDVEDVDDVDLREMVQELRDEMREMREMMRDIRAHVRSRDRAAAGGRRTIGFGGRASAPRASGRLGGGSRAGSGARWPDARADGGAPKRDANLLRLPAVVGERRNAARDR